jgi:hypothetical protein
MKAIVREGIEAGAVGISFERNPRHFDWDGRLAPTNLAADSEIFAVASVVDEVGRGVIQFGGDRKLGTEVAKKTRCPVFYGNITQAAVAPDRWRKQLEETESLMRQGHRAYQFVMPRPGDLRYTLKTAQHFDAMATWKKIMLLPSRCACRLFVIRKRAPSYTKRRWKRRSTPISPAILRGVGICNSSSSRRWLKTNAW